MTKVKIFAAAACLLLLAASAAKAAERTLFTLRSAPPNSTVLRIVDVRGAQRADPIATSDRWTLRPGTPLPVAERPPDRVVEIYSGTALAPFLLCRVALRYYPGDGGWVPQFRLEDEPAVGFVNGRWQLAGDINGLVRFGGTLPNADGFFPAIEFGLGAGQLAIVAWRVR
jgi:hypothetical protein